MASADIRAARTVKPVRAARAPMSAGESARASNRPSSLAANRCFAAIKPDAIFMICSGPPPGVACTDPVVCAVRVVDMLPPLSVER